MTNAHERGGVRDAGVMRARLLLILSAALTLVLVVLAAVTFWPPSEGGASTFTVSVADLDVGSAKAIRVTLPGPRDSIATVFLARSAANDVHAFLAKSTHLGCRLVLPGDPKYGQGFTTSSSRYFFEDPCGGSTWALDGDCTAGPCPRALDRYPVQLHGDNVAIDLDHLHLGARRGAVPSSSDPA